LNNRANKKLWKKGGYMDKPKKTLEDAQDSRLTVQLPKSLIRKIKLSSIENNQTIKETCEKALKEYIANHTDNLS